MIGHQSCLGCYISGAAHLEDCPNSLANKYHDGERVALLESWVRHIVDAADKAEPGIAGDIYEGKLIFLPTETITLMRDALDGRSTLDKVIDSV